MQGLPGWLKPEVEVKVNAKEKVYPNGFRRITICSKPVFKNDEYMELVTSSSSVPKEKDLSNPTRGDSLRRAKEKIYDIAMCNDFEYFITWTLDKEMIDRYDAKLVSKNLKVFLNNLVKRKEVRYLVVPELHEDGAIHMHGLIAGKLRMVDSGRKLPDGRSIFNMPEWKLGFSTAIELDNQKGRVSSYIVKYVQKDFQKIFGNFYYAGGHGLVRSPEVNYFDVDFGAFDLPVYGPEGVPILFKYLDVLPDAPEVVV